MLDVPYLCYRAKYTTGQLSYQEVRTGVVYGFLRDVGNLSEKFRTQKLVFCFDSYKSKRKQLFAGYKATRYKRKMDEDEAAELLAFRTQVQELRTKWLPQIGFANIFEREGYEADDLIAAICQQHRKSRELIIVTSDHDLYQCLDDQVAIYDPRQSTTITSRIFEQENGVFPSEWVKVKALAGCSSDEVPGIQGVGEKTALRFLRGELPEQSKIYQRILESQDLVARNMKLVWLPLDKQVNNPPLKLQKEAEFSIRKWNKVCRELGIRSLMHVGT